MFGFFCVAPEAELGTYGKNYKEVDLYLNIKKNFLVSTVVSYSRLGAFVPRLNEVCLRTSVFGRTGWPLFLQSTFLK